jgi:hypothetical protein
VIRVWVFNRRNGLRYGRRNQWVEEEEIDGRREGIDGRSKGIGGSPCGRRNRRFALVCVFAYLCLCFGTYLVVFIFNNNNNNFN